MAKAATKKAAKKGIVKRAVSTAASAVKRVAKRATKKAARHKPATALERQAENLGRMAGRAAAVLDKVRAEGAATVASLKPGAAKRAPAKKKR